MKRCTLHTCFICGIIRRLILWAIVHKKENYGSIVIAQSRKFTSSFLTIKSLIHFQSDIFYPQVYTSKVQKCHQLPIPLSSSEAGTSGISSSVPKQLPTPFGSISILILLTFLTKPKEPRLSNYMMIHESTAPEGESS